MASDAGAWQEQAIETNGVRLHVVTQGESGPLVILLHGFPECWYSWRAYLPALAEAGFRAAAPDMRGYNLSEKPKGIRSYDLPALTADVLGLIRAFGEEKAVIVGHDWGAVVAWRFAMDYPQAVEKLVICNVPHPARFAEGLWTPHQLRKSRYIFFFQLPWLPELMMRRNLPRLVERAMRGSAVRQGAFSDEDLQVYTEALRQPGALTASINYYRAAARWGRKLPTRPITAPTLIIWGEEDRFLGKELVPGTERFVPDLQVKYIPNCGHWVQQEARVEVTGALLEFFGSASGYHSS